MTKGLTAPIASFFADLTDPRGTRRRQHRLLDIMTIALCASICGADNWVDIALFGRAKRDWFKRFLDLRHGIPSHDTFGRVFARLDPEEFQRSFAAWVQAVAEVTKGQVIAIDGKTLRRSHDRSAGKGPIHMVNVWAAANGLALGQAKVDEKSNEITAIPLLLRMLDVSGCIVTIDAMGCQREIAKQIIAGGADYILAVKENQGGLHADIQDLFDGAEAFAFEAIPHEEWQATTKGHGRIEARQCWTIADPGALSYIRNLQAWPMLASVVKITAQRSIGVDTSTETRYFISSLAGDAKQIAQAVRSHWAVENSLHWVLDIAFREDESRVRKDHSPQNMAVLRQITLNLLKHNAEKASIKSKRLMAGWSEDFLLQVLFG
jgi:predicted transposase YbfD/YdcC